MITKAERSEAQEVMALLEASSLPTAGVSDHFDSFLIARGEDGSLTGCIGLEV